MAVSATRWTTSIHFMCIWSTRNGDGIPGWWGYDQAQVRHAFEPGKQALADEAFYVGCVRRVIPQANDSLIEHIGKSIHFLGRGMLYQQKYNMKKQDGAVELLALEVTSFDPSGPFDGNRTYAYPEKPKRSWHHQLRLVYFVQSPSPWPT